MRRQEFRGLLTRAGRSADASGCAHAAGRVKRIGAPGSPAALYARHMPPSLHARLGCQDGGLKPCVWRWGAVRSQGADVWRREIGFEEDRSNGARG